MARQVLSSYRRDDFADPDNYLIQLGRVLEAYHDQTIREATDPISGIQRNCKWPPSIAEVAEFCDEIQRRSSFSARWDAQSRRQLDERDHIEHHHERESLEQRRRVADRIAQELSEKGMHINGLKPIAMPVEIDKLLEEERCTPKTPST